MNIYIDIDGVLLANENSAAPYADEFLQQVMKKFPETTHWLTTHCWKGENRCIEVLSPHLKHETIEMLYKIKPTDWNEWKTDAIDFSKPFLWFDDDLFPDERVTLEKYDALQNYVKVDLFNNPEHLKELLKLVDVDRG